MTSIPQLVARDKPKELALVTAMHKVIQVPTRHLTDSLRGPPCTTGPEPGRTGRAFAHSLQAGGSFRSQNLWTRVQRAFLDLQNIRTPESIEALLAKPRWTWNENSIAPFIRSTRACV